MKKTRFLLTTMLLLFTCAVGGMLASCGDDDEPVQNQNTVDDKKTETPKDSIEAGKDSAETDPLPTDLSKGIYVGGDISMLAKYEKQGAKYYDRSGKAVDNLITFLKEQGWNSMRVRLFVDPSQDNDKCVCQDLEYVKTLGHRIKQAGLFFVLDFHYSDTWADPAKQWTPAAWLAVNDDNAKLGNRIYDYTKDCLQQLRAAGATPDFMQTGNEISYGMLWGAKGSNAYRCYMGKSENWTRFATLLKQAGKACREVCPNADIILHTERTSQPDVLANFYKQMKSAGVDYDIIGLSYYPYFHGGLNVLQTALARMRQDFSDKKVQVVEFGYSYQYEVPGTLFDHTATYPYSEEGQRKLTADVVTLLKQYAPQVNALYWWYPEANARGCTGDLNRDWYNASLFNNNSGRAQAALYELENLIK